MSKKLLLLLAGVGLTASAQTFAQDSDNFVYASYFECDPSREWLADGIFDLVQKPAYDKVVADGGLTGYGWMVHNLGGEWRRILWRSGSSVMQLMESADAVAAAMADGSADAGNEFSAICSEHEDYIWNRANGSADEDAGGRQATVGMSVYYVCDQNGETRADELVEEVIGPMHDGQVKAGNLVSWGWLTHYLGGEYRRVATTRAESWEKLFVARDAIIDAMGEGANAATGQEFTKICHTHTDYLWDL